MPIEWARIHSLRSSRPYRDSRRLTSLNLPPDYPAVNLYPEFHGKIRKIDNLVIFSIWHGGDEERVKRGLTTNLARAFSATKRLGEGGKSVQTAEGNQSWRASLTRLRRVRGITRTRAPMQRLIKQDGSGMAGGALAVRMSEIP